MSDLPKMASSDDGNAGHVYIIAEIGQNHNGDVEIAKKLIDMAAMPIFDFFTAMRLPGVDAVKLTKRDLDEEMTDEAANQPYDSPHSFGKTYGEHRRALELSFDEHKELELYARSKGLGFVETLCSPGCLRMLDTVQVDAVKVASRDITNIPLLEALGELSHKVILSSGMSDIDEIRRAVEIVRRKPKPLAVLHCVSQYPAEYQNLNLRAIPRLREELPDVEIGYSDHSIGIMAAPVAVSLGATIIEKHITLNRNMKGSDHAGSLEPEGLWRVVRDVRNVEMALGHGEKTVPPCVLPVKRKLSRSIASMVPIAKGERIKESYLCLRSPGIGVPWSERELIVGKAAKRDIPKNCLILPEDVEEA